jgi:manganese transport protein
MTVADWMAAAGQWRMVIWLAVIPVGAALLLLLLWVTMQPWVRRRARLARAVEFPELVAGEVPGYQRILVPLDHSNLDLLAINHAAAMASLYGARLFLVHVEEDATSQVYGHEASTAEVEAGSEYLERIAQSLQDHGITVETSILHSPSPTKEIVRYARQVQPDLVVMGAHGHGGIKDLIFGTTIDPVRHALDIPILVVRKPRR